MQPGRWTGASAAVQALQPCETSLLFAGQRATHRLVSQLLGCPEDAHGDLATVGCQNFGDIGLPVLQRRWLA